MQSSCAVCLGSSASSLVLQLLDWFFHQLTPTANAVCSNLQPHLSGTHGKTCAESTELSPSHVGNEFFIGAVQSCSGLCIQTSGSLLEKMLAICTEIGSSLFPRLLDSPLGAWGESRNLGKRLKPISVYVLLEFPRPDRNLADSMFLTFYVLRNC